MNEQCTDNPLQTVTAVLLITRGQKVQNIQLSFFFLTISIPSFQRKFSSSFLF